MSKLTLEEVGVDYIYALGARLNVISFFDGMNFLNSYTQVVSSIRSRLIMQYMIIWIHP